MLTVEERSLRNRLRLSRPHQPDRGIHCGVEKIIELLCLQ
jgi:hypothetical protein